MVYDLDGVARADLLAAVNDAAAAGGRHEDAADGAFVAGDVDHLDDVGVVFVPAQGKLDALLHDGALFNRYTYRQRIVAFGPGEISLGISM